MVIARKVCDNKGGGLRGAPTSKVILLCDNKRTSYKECSVRQSHIYAFHHGDITVR